MDATQFFWQEEMRAPAKKVTRIFVARIPPSVSEATFRGYLWRIAWLRLFLAGWLFIVRIWYPYLIFFCSYFEKYGEITDLYMPKVPLSLRDIIITYLCCLVLALNYRIHEVLIYFTQSAGSINQGTSWNWVYYFCKCWYVSHPFFLLQLFFSIFQVFPGHIQLFLCLISGY